MSKNIVPLTNEEWEKEEKQEIDAALAALYMARYKKEKLMLKKLYMLSLEHKLYMLPCHDCGGEVDIVPIECTQPDIFRMQCKKCAKRQDQEVDYLENIYKFNKEIIERYGKEEPKCSFCDGEVEVVWLKNSNGGELCLACKKCGKYIN